MDAAPPPSSDAAAAREDFVAKDRAKRFVFRLSSLRRERATAYAGSRAGMASFVEGGAALAAILEDLRSTVEAVLAGRLRDRERGETEIPLAVALESVAERVRRALAVEEARRASRIPAEWAERRVLALLDDACARLDAFAAVYDAKRFAPETSPVDVARCLKRVEEDAALDRAPALGLSSPGLLGPAADRPTPRLLSASDALEDVLRAARAEVARAAPPWRVTLPSPDAFLVLSLGAAGPGSPPRPRSGPDFGASASDADGAAAARTDRAAQVLRFLHAVEVLRVVDDADDTVGVALRLEDRAAKAVGDRLAAGAPLSPAADAAVRAYVLAARGGGEATDPARLVAVLGVFQAVDAEAERLFLPALSNASTRIAAQRLPRDVSRKAPVKKGVVDALSSALPGFPAHRVGDVVEVLSAGRVIPGVLLHLPDLTVVLAVLGRHWPAAGGFGDRVLPVDPWTDDDVLASIREAIDLSAIRASLEKGQDPGPGWPDRFEKSAFGLLSRLSRLSRPPG